MLLPFILVFSLISCSTNLDNFNNYDDLDNDKLEQVLLVDRNIISSILEHAKSHKENVWFCSGGYKCRMEVFKTVKKDKICRFFNIFIENDLGSEKFSLEACRIAKNNWTVV